MLRASDITAAKPSEGEARVAQLLAADVPRERVLRAQRFRLNTTQCTCTCIVSGWARKLRTCKVW